MVDVPFDLLRREEHYRRLLCLRLVLVQPELSVIEQPLGWRFQDVFPQSAEAVPDRGFSFVGLEEAGILDGFLGRLLEELPEGGLERVLFLSMRLQVLPLRVEVVIGRDLLRVRRVGRCGWRRRGQLPGTVGLYAAAAEGDAVVDVGGEGGVEAVLGDELLGESAVLVVLVEEDAVGAFVVDLDLDDGWVARCVPMSAPRGLARL